MKLSLIFVLMGFNLSALASSYTQVHCSNSDGTIKWSEGRRGNQIQIFHRGVHPKTETLNDYRVDILNDQVLESSNEKSCVSSERSFGSTQWSTTYFRKVRISKADTTLLSDDVSGISKDHRSIEVSLICQESGGSDMSCLE
jgi:hypothetical protein